MEYPLQNENLFVREIAGERVLYNRKTGEVLFLNETATHIFELCDGKHGREHMVKSLLARYDASLNRIELDLDQTLRLLIEKGAILPDETAHSG